MVRLIIFAVFLFAKGTIAQEENFCQCAIFLQTNPTNRYFGPAHFLNSNATSCDDASHEECEENCELDASVWTQNTTLTDEKEPGIQWGTYLCESTYSNMGQPEVAQNWAGYLLAYDRMLDCDLTSDWHPSDVQPTNPHELCCVTPGVFVPDCP